MGKFSTTNVGAFHGSLYEQDFGRFVFGGNGTETITGERHIVTQTRTLRFRFLPHFHPYIEALKQRLIAGSVRGLLAADTDYVQENDGSFLTLPQSFRAALPKDLALKLPKVGAPQEMEDIILAGSVIVMLPDGATISLDDASVVALPGNVIADASRRGTQVLRGDGQKVFLETESVVALASGAAVMLPENIIFIGANGEPRRLIEPAQVVVPAGTQIKLLGGKPLPRLFKELFSSARYDPTDLVQLPHPAKNLDFTSSGAYSVYNWELFFHIPLTVAIHLSKNQRYEEAMRWFHFIFDPTDDSDGPSPERYWKVKPFQYTDVQQIEDILVNLATGADPLLQQETINSIGAWKDAPFRPHVVARYRQTAYMFKTVMAYLDNLIAWGDSLFRQDTGEAINEATQLYVLAANILGPRPQAVPKKGSVRPQTYANLLEDLDAFGNAMEQIENEAIFDLAPFPIGSDADGQFAVLRSIGTALYFCVPRNDKLLTYWDTIADRLFKIRNSLNIQGIFRQLPLFEPPIDPALLARAAAAGLDIGAVIGGINQPLPLVRFQILIQKATELCQEVKSLGSNLLAALEKEDNETLAILRARHEKVILGLAEMVKYAQWQEAIKGREGLEVSLINAAQRYIYYERLLGREEGDIEIPELEALDSERLAKLKFKADEPQLARRPIEVDIADDASGEAGGKMLSRHEVEEMGKLKDARKLQESAAGKEQTGAGLSLLPEIGVDFHFWGLGGHISFGGSALSRAMSFWGSFARTDAEKQTYEAGRSGKVGSYARREQEWAFQSSMLAGEINQMYKQLRAAQIREAIAERDWKNHQRQIQHAEEIEDFLTNEKTGKKTNQAFYAWMKREVRGLYGQVFQFAFDVAKKAERALQHELGRPDISFLQFGYLGGKEGLLAGEKLFFDLKRMEMAYYELNQREYELTKHASLMQVSPTALLELRTTGRCTVSLPEALFDMDGPGHYFRRIKTVAVSIPSVAGPYTSVNCTLTLTKSSIRIRVDMGDGYMRTGTEDSRFSDHFGSLQSIVTSSAQNDTGLFETNLHDERYLPFEGSGAISEWQLELPADVRQFDYSTISDVILHIRYTAREAGGLLRKGAVDALKGLINDAQATGSVRLFSIRHEFPSEWMKFKAVKIAGAITTAQLTFKLREEHYPFWSRGKLKTVARAELFVDGANNNLVCSEHADGTGKTDDLVEPIFDNMLLHGILNNLAPVAPIGDVTLYLSDNAIDDLWLAITWKP